MTSPITITVPREAALLRLAAEFMTKAAEHVTANPETLRVLSQRAGDVEVTVGSIGGDEQELSDIMEEVQAATPVPLVEVMDDVFIPATDTPQIDPVAAAEYRAHQSNSTPDPVDVAAAFAPKPTPTPSIFAEYVMADPNGFTREQYHVAGWTDAQLLKAGHMAEVVKAPAAPVAAAPTPPPAPTAPAPTSTTAPAPTPAPPTSGATPSGEVDSEGTPWDARIHASTKTKMASDGTWKLKRGVDKSVVDLVKSELRQLTGGKAAVAAPPAARAPIPAPVAAPKAPTAVAPGAALMKRVTDAIRQQLIAATDVLAAAQHPTVGLKEVRELCLPGNEHLVPIAEKILFPQG